MAQGDWQVKRRGTRTITLKHGQKTVVDQETYNWAKHWNWYLLTHHRGDDYAATSLFNPDGRFQVYLHQLIRKPVEGFQVDHINGNSLDNRISNIRHVTMPQNMRNRKVHREGKLIGGCFRKETGKWLARIQINKKKKYLGVFDTPEEAHEAYVNAIPDEKRCDCGCPPPPFYRCLRSRRRGR